MVIQVNEIMMRVLMKAYYLLWTYRQILMEIYLRINSNTKHILQEHIFHLQEYMFSSFCNIIILLIHLIRYLICFDINR